MKRILFVTCRNIVNTSGELRLIKNRSEVLYETFDICTDFMVFTNKDYVESENIEAGGSFELFKYNKKNIISMKQEYVNFLNAIVDKIQLTKYCAVIVSGSQILNCIPIIKNTNSSIPIVSDIHGAYEELIEFNDGNIVSRIIHKALYKYTKHNERVFLKQVDYLLAVSNALSMYLQKEYRIDGEKIFIVPCAMKKFDMDLVELKNKRNAARRLYNVGDEEILFIYSGGSSPWQCIDESVVMYEKIKNTINKKTKLLLLSNNKSCLEKYKANDVIIDSLSSKDVNNVLPAGDYAFLIRRECITNKVAYPNKFIEYVAAGLKVISTNGVEDVAKQIVSYKVGHVGDIEIEQNACSYILESGEYGNDFLNRQKLLDDNCFDNTLKSLTRELCEKYS